MKLANFILKLLFLEGVHFINLIKVYNQGLQAHARRLISPNHRMHTCFANWASSWATLLHSLPILHTFTSGIADIIDFFSFTLFEKLALFSASEKQGVYHIMTIRFDHSWFPDPFI